jgi:uncharacterized protein involved in response to NO
MMTIGAPVWSSGFRPFYLLGALYAPLLVVGVSGAFVGVVNLPGSAPQLWHGHEMIFGFAVAIIIGTLLTALPSWAGTPELRGGRLVTLVALWLLGRIAFWASPWLPNPLIALADSMLMPVLFAMLAPQVWRARNRLFRLLLPILLALALANLAYHAGVLWSDPALARQSLRASVYGVLILFVLKGGVLTPIFTGNALRLCGRGNQPSFHMGLEASAAGTVVLLAALDLGGAPAHWVGWSALSCAIVHSVRTARWRGWRVPDDPQLWAMHLGFAWLVLSFVLKALADLSGSVPDTAWVHAFTVGSLGMMMLGLMTRVSLRHTGRALVVPRSLRWAFVAMFAAASLRLATTVQDLGPWAVALAALLWASPFGVFLVLFASVLVSPSRPRAAVGAP